MFFKRRSPKFDSMSLQLLKSDWVVIEKETHLDRVLNGQDPSGFSYFFIASQLGANVLNGVVMNYDIVNDSTQKGVYYSFYEEYFVKE